MSADPRGGRIAVVPGSLPAERLEELGRDGWGVIQLPPPELDGEARDEWLAITAEQVAEYRRTGYEVVLVDDGEWRQELADALARLGAEPL